MSDLVDPVVVARALGRPGERALVIELAALLPEHADMETVLLVGSRATRAFRHGEAMRVFTPRGYGAA